MLEIENQCLNGICYLTDYQLVNEKTVDYKSNKKIIVCIPAYNEGKIIEDIVHESKAFCNQVIVCDDGSTDDTETKAKKAGAIVIRHKENKGKGAAMKSLFNTAKDSSADVIVTIDGDGQFLPQEIDKLTKPILEGKADIVIGYRFVSDNEIPGYRKMGIKFLDKMTNMASELPFRDTQSGFRAYSSRAIQMISFQSNGFGADAEILIDGSRKGLRIIEEKVTVLYYTGHETSTKDPISHATDVVTSLIELIALRRPLAYLGIPSIILIAIGIAYSIVVIAIFNETRYFSIPSTLVAMGALVLGIMLLLMSVVLFAIGRAMRRQYS